MLYLHWTDLVDRDKVPHLFHLFGQEYRELKLTDEEPELNANEISAILELKKIPYHSPEKIFTDAMDSWKRAGAQYHDIERAENAWDKLETQPDSPIAERITPLNDGKEVDVLSD